MSKHLKIALLGLGHLLVDLQGIYLVNRQYQELDFEYIALFFLIYNIIAFGFQPVVGYIADKKNLYFLYIILGLFLPLVGLLTMNIGIIAVIISTLGNAMYHVGGGVVSINLYPKKAMPAGVFVAPGAIGVFLGVMLSKAASDLRIYIALMVIGVIVGTFFVFKDNLPENRRSKISDRFIEIVLLIMGVVFVRGLIGTTLLFTWKSDLTLAIILVVSVFLGKFLGGILGDKYGYKKIGIGGLLVSIPFLILGCTFPVLGILGALFFNLTMAITLFVIIDSLGMFKGFAFGLTTLSLLISYLPSAFGLEFDLGLLYYGFIIIFVVIGVYLLNRALRIYNGGV